MSTILFANNATTTLAGAITNVAVSATLATGSGALFPNPSGSEYFVATLVDAATGDLKEIVWVTARSADTVTLTRGQEGTTALAWSAGDFFSNFWTAGQAAAMAQTANIATGVTEFNTRTGNVTLTSSDVTTALGFTPAPNSAEVPTGSMLLHAANTPPTGYLECNAASLSTTTYAALFAVIGYTFGGSGASFSLPDMRGYFARGWNHGAGSNPDSGRAFGSTQQDEFQDHKHTLNNTSGVLPAGTTGEGFTGVTGTNTSTPVLTTDAANTASGSSGAPRVGAETRPVNVALMYIIKT